MILRCLKLLLPVVLMSGVPVAAWAEEWGTLKGQFIYDGKSPPAPKPIDASKEPTCAMHKLSYEDLVVGKNGGLKDAVILLKTENVDVAPEYEKTAKDDAVLDNKNCQFMPHVLLMRTSQPLVVKNSDPVPVSHNSKVDPANNPAAAQNLTIPPGQEIKLDLPSEESRPVPVSCGIHTWMKAYIFVRKSPYMAVSDDKGNFEIKDLPVGKELQFQLWQEKPGFLKDVKIKGAKDKTDKKGIFKLKIKPGENDLGEIKVSPSLFK